MKVTTLWPGYLVGGSFPTYIMAVRRLGQAITEKSFRVRRVRA